MGSGMSPTWTVATCLGQGTCTPEQAVHLAEIFGLSETEALFLQQVPTRKGPERVPNDPLLYRLHEVSLSVSLFLCLCASVFLSLSIIPVKNL